MNTAVYNKLVSFIWSIADDCLRDVYVRGKLLSRLDALLGPTKEAVAIDSLALENENDCLIREILNLA
ncbi:MAG: hypothetical protein EOO91_01095 [Pedobacter sp.]|nr:MAG: hypothetical protein EOO91_01095 [Pedobacter sp.]